MKKQLKSDHIEAVGTAWFISKLIAEGFEVAIPSIDHGIDLIVFRERGRHGISAVPIQLKIASGESFSIDRKYKHRGLLMAYIWYAVSDRPKFFIVPEPETVFLLDKKTRETDSFKKEGKWSFSRPSKKLKEKLNAYAGRLDLVEKRLRIPK
jgi:hypothetical protein